MILLLSISLILSKGAEVNGKEKSSTRLFRLWVSRNYTKSVSEGKSGERLEINKFCKYCNQYTLHKETK